MVKSANPNFKNYVHGPRTQTVYYDPKPGLPSNARFPRYPNKFPRPNTPAILMQNPAIAYPSSLPPWYYETLPTNAVLPLTSNSWINVPSGLGLGVARPWWYPTYANYMTVHSPPNNPDPAGGFGCGHRFVPYEFCP
jgi:hypothetical protein